MTKLDYTLDSPEERLQIVNKILEEQPNISKQYLEILADYLCFCMEKKEKQEKKILTENRLATVNKRETSFEGLVSKFENGEDGIYNILDNNKHTIFQPKIQITKRDIEEIPELQQTSESIKYWSEMLPKVSGKNAFIAKKAIIDSRKDQYIIKDAFRKPTTCSHLVHSTHYIPLESKEWVDEEGQPQYEGISLMNPKVCSAILCNYSKLKQDSYGNYMADTWYLMEYFDKVAELALKKYPVYEKIVLYKIDGRPNTEIQQLIEEEFGILHSMEYISSLWRNKIPATIAKKAEDLFLDNWYLNEEKGQYKKCSRCGKIKLASNRYFSKNKTSKDGYYSICKDCRNARAKKL